MAIRINGIDRESTLTSKTAAPQNTYHLADNPNLYEIQRSNNFEFIVTDIDGIIRAGMTGTEASAVIANAQEILRLSVSSSSVPHFSQNAIEVKRGNNTLKYAGTPTFDDNEVVFNDYIGADDKSILMAWQALSYNTSTQKVGIATDYKKDCYLNEYSPDYQKVRGWVLHGCWISSLKEDEYNNESNEAKKIQCTITYDWAEIDTSELI